jgi:PAS domain S-box-containing protein
VEDGARIWGVHVTPISQDGEVTQLVLAMRNITERKEREETLARRTQAIEKAPIGITLSNPDLEDNPLTYVNEAYVDLTGYSREEIVGRNCRFLQGGNTDVERVTQIREAIDSQEEIGIDIRNYRKDGTEFWNHLEIAPVRDDEGEVINYVGFQQDVTERKERERELSMLKERYETLLAAAPDPVFVADGETGEIIEANDAAETLLGMSSDEIIGSHQSELHPSDQAGLYRQLFEEHVQAEGTRRRLPDGSPIYMTTDNGDHVPVEIRVNTVSLPNGPVTYGVFRDISERVERDKE